MLFEPGDAVRERAVHHALDGVQVESDPFLEHNGAKLLWRNHFWLVARLQAAHDMLHEFSNALHRNFAFRDVFDNVIVRELDRTRQIRERSSCGDELVLVSGALPPAVHDFFRVQRRKFHCFNCPPGRRLANGRGYQRAEHQPCIQIVQNLVAEHCAPQNGGEVLRHRPFEPRAKALLNRVHLVGEHHHRVHVDALGTHLLHCVNDESADELRSNCSLGIPFLKPKALNYCLQTHVHG
mmetsp:Transcript_32843/g.66661  ORF Transcript_32843/g.66661 Transcript_32843/m.66661 type:complete len:238 (-) Transcript_32843:422-1135(-)